MCEALLESPEGWGVIEKRPFCVGGVIYIFWNDTFQKNTHTVMDGKLEILAGSGIDGLGDSGGMGDLNLKNSSSGVTFNFNLD